MKRNSMLALCAVSAVGAWSCSEAKIHGGDDSAADTSRELSATQYVVALRTSEQSLYVVAEEGGNGAVNANRPGRGPWETFTLRDLNGGRLEDQDTIALQANDGHWISCEGGGGSSVSARGAAPEAWEKFTLIRARGRGEVADQDQVALRTVNGHFLVAELGGGDVVNANRTAAGAWETFVLELGSAPTPPPGGNGNGVRPDDVVLLPPVPLGTALATVTGYEMNSPCPFADAHCERPLYLSYDRDDPEWWDVLVQELLASRVNVVMAHGRGCYDPNSGTSGNGNMCPRLLTRLIDAIDRAGANDVLRLGMFDDTGAYQGTRTAVDHLPDSERFDVGDRTAWRFFWDHNIRVWFDTVPKRLWYRMNGRPVIAFWTLSSYFFSNQRGNASAMLRDLRAKFQARYGEDPLFILDGSWTQEDPTITTTDAQGLNNWFDPNQSVYTYTQWAGAKWGALVPSYRNPDTAPGCGASCREQTRRNGQTLRNAFDVGRDAKLTLLEGWTNVVESAGFYRSDAWDYPNQYVNIVREYADPELPTLKLEAEAADAFDDFSPENRGGRYRPGALDVGRLNEAQGWFVGWTESGESLTFRDTKLPCGTWRFTARASGHGRLHLEVLGQSLGTIEVNAGRSYELLHLGETRLNAGRGDVRVVFDEGGVDLDWVFLKRATRCN